MRVTGSKFPSSSESAFFPEKRIAYAPQYYSNLCQRISDVMQKLQQNPDHQAFIGAQQCLEFEAEMALKGKVTSCLEYVQYQQAIEDLQETALKKLDQSGLDADLKKWFTRWMRSESIQRQFALIKQTDLPYRWDEIPKGAIVLCNPDSWFLKHKLQNHQLTFMQKIIKKIKGLVCRIFTGKSYTHAELSLGNGDRFDLQKKRSYAGNCVIEDRSKKICFDDVYFPDQEKMVEAHNARFREHPVADFNELWGKIEEEVRANGTKCHGNFRDIVTVILPHRRSANYDCVEDWKPGEKTYGCSPTISALFGKFGIDIGAQFGKKVVNITPANLSVSEFFHW